MMDAETDREEGDVLYFHSMEACFLIFCNLRAYTFILLSFG